MQLAVISEVLLNAHWIVIKVDKTPNPLQYCNDTAVTFDTITGGNGSNVISLYQNSKHIGFGIKNDQCAGAITIRWYVDQNSHSPITDQDLNEI